MKKKKFYFSCLFCPEDCGEYHPCYQERYGKKDRDVSIEEMTTEEAVDKYIVWEK